MIVFLAALPAFADTPAAPEFQPPNSIIGVSVGYPWLIGGRGEAWFADEGSVELGAGTAGDVGDTLGTDWAVRWRPDFACLNCGEQILVTFGLGLGGLVVPDLQLDGPWEFAVGPDLVATGVLWFSTTVGFQLSGRVGIGPGWVGDEFDAIEAKPWAFLTAGLAF
jgi:hypothetical protein